MANKWDDEKIQKTLSEIPDIKDSRSKEDVLLRLKQDSRLKNRAEQSIRKNKRNFMPAFAAIAVILVLAFLIPSMIKGDKGPNQSENFSLAKTEEKMMTANDDSAGQESEEMADTNLDVDDLSIQQESEESILSNNAVYPSEVDGFTVFRLGVASEAAASIPVTFLIPNNQIQEDFGDVQPNSLELYQKYAGQIDEEALGFNDYHPYKGSLSSDGDVLIHTLPIGHGYDMATATLSTFTGTLHDTFYGFKEIRFENEDGSLVEFDQVGEPSPPMKLYSGLQQMNYYKFKQSDGQEFLSSNFSYTYDNLEMALQDMKVKPNDVFSPVIPNDVNFEVINENEVAVVKFEDELDLLSMSKEEADQLIDGISLTAASFNQQIQLENIVQTEWNGLNLTKPLPKPVGPNILPFLLK